MKKYSVLFIFGLLLYSRFIGLDWGLPFPMHPDERNMVDAVMRLKCNVDGWETFADLQLCYNPGFFAYGQLPLYMGFLAVKIWQGIFGLFEIKKVINFSAATLGLRIVSAFLSLFLCLAMWKMYRFMRSKLPEISSFQGSLAQGLDILVLLILVFQPYLIQYAHFGTTETFLMLLYVLTTYYSLRFIERPSWKWVAASAAMVGFASGIKTSGLIYIAVPVVAIFYTTFRKEHFALFRLKIYALFRYACTFSIVVTICYILAAPHNILSWKDFIISMRYEVPVGNGTLLVFYTRQFIDTIPYLFQFTHIFPYALGLPILTLFIIGFVALPWKNPYVLILRFAWLAYFLVTGSLFVKWSRFMAPIMPLMTIFSIFGLLFMMSRLNIKRNMTWVILVVVGVVTLLPGIAYLTIYRTPDVRFVASKVIADTVPPQSKIFEEAGNVINIPIPPPNTQFIIPYYSFVAANVYELNSEEDMQSIQPALDQADVVVIPSRRIFASRTCLRPSDVMFTISEYLLIRDCEKVFNRYPYHQRYYQQLFSETSPFIQTAEISSYPRIELFGKILMEFPDEFAEETWTVFDHPVIRLYKRASTY